MKNYPACKELKQRKVLKKILFAANSRRSYKFFCFYRQGEYVITLTARNPVSSSSVRQMLFVLNEPYCNEPKVSILAETGMKVKHRNTRP